MVIPINQTPIRVYYHRPRWAIFYGATDMNANNCCSIDELECVFIDLKEGSFIWHPKDEDMSGRSGFLIGAGYENRELHVYDVESLFPRT